MNPNDSYISHPLNSSKTKQSHIFSRQQRFNKRARLATQAIYKLPSTQTKRSTCFGFGNKMNFGGRGEQSPPPGSYKLPSDFDKKGGPAIAEGRDKVSFGSFLLQALKRNKDVPSPDRYQIQAKRDKIGGGIGQRINTDNGERYKRSIPGPGTYKTTATQIANGNYFLSTFKNNTSPRFHELIKPKQFIKPRSSSSSVICTSPPISDDVQQQSLGRFTTSKYKNIITNSFSKSKRDGMCNKHSLFTPGFKYQSFSEFGS